ncbi:hypothetical protein KY285_020026 [Solanum tuberosum]|nr:hypothetical protein KY289_020265 [Solanum tuberosum]KAH0692929.1 hypothetical protein KY285_020026 [Solanum tuberosum]
MADAFVSFAVQKLGDFLIQQVSLRTSLREKVEWLRNELLFIQSFLKDAELKQCGGRRQNSTTSVRRFNHSSSESYISLVSERLMDYIFVRLQDVVQILLAQLLKEEPRRSVLSIYGMGGLGKTTLARNLYRSSNIVSSFPTRAWICVSQEYNTTDLLKTIIKSIQVVVEDVWQREAWESLKRAFPDSKNESRVIITTRKADVAEKADDRCFVHKLCFLSKEESWDLFCRKLLDVRAMVPEMERLPRDMVEKCGGLPISIIVLSGLLSHKGGLEEWKKVKDHLWKNIIEDKSIEISNILSLTYNDLTTVLKQCFLYFGSHTKRRRKMEDVAEGFLKRADKTKLDTSATYIWGKRYWIVANPQLIHSLLLTIYFLQFSVFCDLNFGKNAYRRGELLIVEPIDAPYSQSQEQSWIRLCGITYATDTATVWADLKERFDKVDGSRGYQLHREICTISQGTSSVSAYFTRLRLLWDEFDALVAPPSCGCDKSIVYASHLQYMKLFAFLMGLNESYTQARSQILMMIPLPSVNKAYSKIISDESQRVTAGSYSGGNLGISTALYVGKDQRQYTSGGSYSGGDVCLVSHTSGGAYSGGDACASASTALYANRVCKLKGLTKETCYRVVGYPPDYKFRKKSGNNANRLANANEKYGQILRLLNKENSVIPAVNQADMDHSSSISNKLKHWVVDTSATKRITASLDDLFDIVALQQSDQNHVQLPYGGRSMGLVRKQEFDHHVKNVRSDNGGIVHQSSCPHTPQQNGVVKRKHRHVLEVARSIMFQGGMPIKFWGECVVVAVYLINRLPTPKLEGQSPYEVFHQRKPKLDHLRTVGCLCYATTLIRRDKFSPRATACVVMGYSLTQKGYILYNIADKKFMVSRDVVFKEYVFPFKKMHEDSLPLFPNINPSLKLEQDQVPADTNVADHIPDVSYASITVADTADSLNDTVNVPESPPTITVTRKSSRTVITPAWHQDYITTGKKKPHSLSNYASYQHISPTYKAYLSKFSTVNEPTSYEEAIQDEKWMTAMQQELQALDDNGTWNLVPWPQGKPVICCKCIFKIKYKADG